MVRVRRRQLVGLARATAVAVFVATVMLGYLGVRLYQDSIALRASPLDNVQWSISRLEIAAQRFRATLLDPDAPLAEVRTRFDVFYSRVALIRNGDQFAPLRNDAESAAQLQRLIAFLDDATPLIDGPDADLAASRPALAAALIPVHQAAASLALRGNAFYTAVAAARLRAFETLVLEAAIIAVGLIIILATTLIFLISRDRLARSKQREAAASNARLKAIASVALDPIIVADAKGRVIEYNDAAKQVFGYSRDDAMGEEMASLFIPPEMRDAHRDGMARYLADRVPHVIGKGRLELESMRKSGERFPVELAVGEAQEADGKPIFVGFMRDISRRKATEAELTEARDAALAADRAKSQFIAVMSHEMRTPLNGVLGVLDLLGDTKLDVTQAEYVDVATRSGEILLRHINDVLDITRIEAGRIEFSQESLSIGDLLQEVASVARPGAKMGGSTIIVDPGDAPETAVGDPHRIRQVLLNLAGNAVKFAGGGEIRISARRVGGAAHTDKLEFAVEDRGPGIPVEDQGRIFDDFITLDTAYSRSAGGSGLGLSICRRIVQAMGGEIGLESTPGLGSRFWFRLDLARPDGAAAPPPKPSVADRTGKPLDVLIVEDNEVNRMVARRMLTAEGHKVTEASDGVEGVALAGVRKFDVILMDISMPRMDGVEATRHISATGANVGTPVIGLTAHGAPAEMDHFLAAGMVACLAKPLRRGELARTLAAHADGVVETARQDDAPVIDPEVFDEFIAVLPAEEVNAVVGKVLQEMEAAAAELPDTPLEALAERAHRTAGAVALIGAAQAHAALSVIEAEAKNGRVDEALIADGCERLIEAASVVREFVG